MGNKEHKAFVRVDSDLMPSVSTSLSAGGFGLTMVEDEEEAASIVAAREYSLIVVELMNDRDYAHRFDLVRSVSDAPILALVDAADYSHTEPYNQLADDTMLTHFDPTELAMRAKALVKNISVSWKAGGKNKDRWIFGDLCISIPKFKVTYRREKVNLTPTEFLILQLLAEHPEQVFTREQIFDAAWNEHSDSLSKSVNNHVQRLNNKLKAVSRYDYIKPQWGVGYYFSPPLNIRRKIG